jgi:hypothetical protein
LQHKSASSGEAQIDFGQGPIVKEAQKKRRTHILRAVMSFSRKGYNEAVLSQKTETFLSSLENAFRHFGGMPMVLNVDNFKAAACAPTESGETRISQRCLQPKRPHTWHHQTPSSPSTSARELPFFRDARDCTRKEKKRIHTEKILRLRKTSEARHATKNTALKSTCEDLRALECQSRKRSKRRISQAGFSTHRENHAAINQALKDD